MENRKYYLGEKKCVKYITNYSKYKNSKLTN